MGKCDENLPIIFLSLVAFDEEMWENDWAQLDIHLDISIVVAKTLIHFN